MKQQIKIKKRMSCVSFVVILILMTMAAPLRLQAQAEDIDVRFISPQHDAIWIGVKKIEVRVTGVKPEYLRSVAVYLDGKLVKEFNSPPYRLKYNFGQVPKNRKLEVLVRRRNQRSIRREIHSYYLDDFQEVNVLQVVVPVAVMDRRGNYVSNLKKEDFIILEDGVPQDISYFSKSGKSTFHLCLLIDISASMRDKIQKVKEVAREFLKQLMSKDDKSIIVFFNHEVFEDSDFTSDFNELDNALAIAFPYGATALYDAVAYGVRLMKPIIGHNIIILFSDGEDNSSAIDPYTIINIVKRSNSVIYSIGKKKYMNQYDQYQELLRKISFSSGGITFFLDDVQDVQKTYQKIRKDIQAKFLIRFSPRDKRKRNRFRKITVKLRNKRGYKVRTMKGYYY
ncbi:MAG: VWA domain-containing protein [Candidatus Aminicenantes bacterium]|nr:VWA domain-containing protein [Candidatus Aminicenantes bacterium]NIM79030.1 VWA domain-containing protein [Candidatus Aminicenantes bacterium]NIN18309.1 VWA domain-containing protein [Candidatus Aminicenantes bacterium]NIN42196.1 VWA domain-containing protein [Candidatus Aminicenantes bacterium]NIN84962.1 VWA domain-containing protein [Candidatus Aminicenantes bacterium]